MECEEGSLARISICYLDSSCWIAINVGDSEFIKSEQVWHAEYRPGLRSIGLPQAQRRHGIPCNGVCHPVVMVTLHQIGVLYLWTSSRKRFSDVFVCSVHCLLSCKSVFWQYKELGRPLSEVKC